MMQVQRQSTQEIDEQPIIREVWGKLISLNKAKLDSYEMTEHEFQIGRLPENSLPINDNRLSGAHCKLIYNQLDMSVRLKDLSTNGTFLGDHLVGKGNEVLIKTGDEIFILHKSKVQGTEILGFAFVQIQQTPCTFCFLIYWQKKAIIESNKNDEINRENEAKIKKLDDLGEDVNCPICDDLVYQCVTVMPCLHNFCASCFSDWMQKQKTCPTCRADVSTVKRNPTINNMIDKYLQANPQKKRPESEYSMMDANNKINKDLIKFDQPQQIYQKILVTQPPPPPAARGKGRQPGVRKQPVAQPLKRKVSDYSADSDDGQKYNCAYCKQSVQGFKCPPGQQHVVCLNCKRHFPFRNLNVEDNEKIFHKCGICNSIICNQAHSDCARMNPRGNRKLTLLKDIQVPNQINLAHFRDNVFEFETFKDYMVQNSLTPKLIMQHILRTLIEPGQFHYLVNKRVQKDVINDIDIPLTMDTHICNQCEGALWFYLIFRYRISIKDQLPINIKNRSTCWYGINCATMKHNEDHAKKLDHFCEQIRF